MAYKQHNGYIYIYKPNHPFAQKTGCIKRSRLVVEHRIKRYLTREEKIHHINGIKDDDRPENLELFKSNSDHTKFHHIGLRKPLSEYRRTDFPEDLTEGKTIILVNKKGQKYVCKRCQLCKKLFWTRKRTERPITKTCGTKCLSELATIQLKEDWKKGKYGLRKNRRLSIRYIQ